MRETIPAKSIITCDVCLIDCTRGNPCEAVLTLQANALDYAGHPVGDAGFKLDLCDKCYIAVVGAIEKLKRSEQ